MSYKSYLKHLEEVKASPLFSRWRETAKDCTGKRSSPIELLLLGTLRYLGRGWTLDDLEEQTAISEETHRRFLHVYLFWGSTALYDKYVYLPATSEEARKCAEEYAMAGFPGCLGSGDATHIGMLRCFYKLRNHHMSFKLPMPTRTYNMTVNHRRRILCTTRGHPGRWSDKTLIRFDDLANQLKKGERYEDLTFILLEHDGDGGVKEVEYSGAWTIVDNGYLRWSVLVPPLKLWTTYTEMRFSRWLESMRKDVECTFGILKGRFRILKTGIPLHGIEVCDRIWLTCCALHNFLLEEDGLDTGWNASRYLGADECDQDIEDIQELLGTALPRIPPSAVNDMLTHDSSGMGVGKDRTTEESDDSDEEDEDEEDNGDAMDVDVDADADGDPEAIPVCTLSLNSFRRKLIEHFNILWQRNQIQWPSRTGDEPPPQINSPNERYIG